MPSSASRKIPSAIRKFSDKVLSSQRFSAAGASAPAPSLWPRSKPRSRPRKSAACARRSWGLRTRGETLHHSPRLGDTGGFIAEGRPLGREVAMWLKEIAPERQEIFRLKRELGDAERELGLFQEVLDRLPSPVWRRGRDLRLTWVNAAYAKAVEAASTNAVVETGIELDRGESALAREAAERAEPAQERKYVVIGGTRRSLDITETPLSDGPRRLCSRCDRGRRRASGNDAPRFRPCRHAQQTGDGGCDLWAGSEAAVLQPGVRAPLESRRGLARRRSVRRRDPRSPARDAARTRAIGLPIVEARAPP